MNIDTWRLCATLEALQVNDVIEGTHPIPPSSRSSLSYDWHMILSRSTHGEIEQSWIDWCLWNPEMCLPVRSVNDHDSDIDSIKHGKPREVFISYISNNEQDISPVIKSSQARLKQVNSHDAITH